VNADAQNFSVSPGNLNPPKVMHYHRRPAFALLLYIFQPYLKAISEMRLTQPLSVSFHHLNE